MKYMLDTNICIYLIRKRSVKLADKLHSIEVGEIGISVVTLCEFEYGVENSSSPDQNKLALQQFLLPLLVCALDPEMAVAYGRIRRALKRQPIGIHDLLIAAQAVQLQVTLVTNNVRRFSRVPGLNIENWT